MGKVSRRRQPRWFPGVPLHALAVLCLFLGGMAQAPAPAAEPPTARQVEAAFLLNFTKFIEWPSSAFNDSASPLVICVLGDDPFGRTLDKLVEGEVVNGRKLAAERIARAPAPKSCQVLYISSSEKNIPALISALEPGVLTVGDGASFLFDGGTIAFIVEGRHVRFDVSQRAASKASLSISARLLSVARFVQKSNEKSPHE